MTDPKRREIEHLKLGALIPAKRNARTHSKAQIGQIAASIQRFGFNSPILIDESNTIVAGHGRFAAAKQLGLDEAPCLRITGMTPEEQRAYLLADNQIALNGGWDKEILAGELQELIELNFDIGVTGFELAEADQIILNSDEASTKPIGPEDELPPLPTAKDTVTQHGDCWIMGNHRLVCEDAKEPGALQALIAGEEPDMIFTDAPYNVSVGEISGRGRIKHPEFAEAFGEMSSGEYVTFLKDTLGPAVSSCRDGAIVFTCIDWRHYPEMIEAGRAVGLEQKNLCVWAKTNGGMGTFYRSQHELVAVWKVPGAAHTNTFGLGEKGRSRTNVWTYAGANAFKAERMEELAMHPTVKPVALVADAIRDVTHRGQIVLDIFGGSGTTLIAAQKTGRKARLMEIDPAYCDVIVNRWQRLTGKVAVHADSGEDFETVQTKRAAAKAGWASLAPVPPQLDDVAAPETGDE